VIGTIQCYRDNFIWKPKSEMKRENYKPAIHSVEIELAESPENVFAHLIDLKKWWPENFEGGEIKLNSEFVFSTGDSHYSKNKVIEFAANKKLVWLTTESIRKTDGYDWTGTKFIFNLRPEGNRTLLKFTYDGVVLANESERLIQICDLTIKELFYNFIINGKTNKNRENYTATIEAANSPEEIFQRITNDVAKWWGGKDLSGSSTELNDEFSINHPGAHYSKQKLVEVIPGKKLVWLVTESKLNWLKNQEEWTNTKMIFEIIRENGSSFLHFTHEGLVPEKESYARCSEGWNMVIKDWLCTLVTDGKPHFE
jgi:hypothetical protein